MPLKYLRNVKDALGWLKPHEVIRKAQRDVRVGLHAEDDLAYFRMESWLAPSHWSTARRQEAAWTIERAEPDARNGYDLEVWSDQMPHPPGAITFCWRNPAVTVRQVIQKHDDLLIPLARALDPFRRPVASHIVRKVAFENAVFSIATALPDVVPLLSLPWAAGEFASDTAVLTANQIRMTFMLGAASNREVGYREQRNEIGSIIAGAFGWRALARELAGKIPLGGGLIPKAAIAWAGTQVVGQSLERYYRIGYAYTAAERKEAWDKAIEKGKTVAGALLAGVRGDKGSKGR